MTIKQYKQCDNMGGEDSGSRSEETSNFDWKGLEKALHAQYHWGWGLKENTSLAIKKGNASQWEVIRTNEKNTKHSRKGTGTLVTDCDAPKGVEWGWVVCDFHA